ncbi:hypothetical protein ACIA8O_31000 [Kitasatospora sp. NPDC051853]|uniref:hypothetical protein n=1 Tax=Kitasatospora sp. NPDC051853 TaxID=3364058 RepID=UPI00378E974F
MARRFGSAEAAGTVVDAYRAGRRRPRLTEERRELVGEFARGGFDVSELSSVLVVG